MYKGSDVSFLFSFTEAPFANLLNLVLVDGLNYYHLRKEKKVGSL